MPFFRGTSSEIWGTGEHKIHCANDIKYCYKEPFFRRDTEWDGISDISACLVCFGVFQRTQFQNSNKKSICIIHKPFRPDCILFDFCESKNTNIYNTK